MTTKQACHNFSRVSNRGRFGWYKCDPQRHGSEVSKAASPSTLLRHPRKNTSTSTSATMIQLGLKLNSVAASGHVNLGYRGLPKSAVNGSKWNRKMMKISQATSLRSFLDKSELHLFLINITVEAWKKLEDVEEEGHTGGQHATQRSRPAFGARCFSVPVWVWRKKTWAKPFHVVELCSSSRLRNKWMALVLESCLWHVQVAVVKEEQCEDLSPDWQSDILAKPLMAYEGRSSSGDAGNVTSKFIWKNSVIEQNRTEQNRKGMDKNDSIE